MYKMSLKTVEIEEVKGDLTKISNHIPSTFKKLKTTTIELFQQKTISFENIHDIFPIIIELMKQLKSYEDLKGSEKRELITEVIIESVQDIFLQQSQSKGYEINKDKEKHIKTILEELVPRAIDLFFELNQHDSGMFKVIQSKETRSFLKKLTCCFIRSLSKYKQ